MERLCQDRNNCTKIAIVGGGASGIYCALNILRMFKEANYTKYFLYIFDKAQVLRTILPTGNGRCNITNNISDYRELASNYPRGEKFLYSIFSRYGALDTIDFFNSIGVKTYIQYDNRVFPRKNSAKFVKDCMINELNKFENFKIVRKEIKNISELKEFDKVIISTGSKSSDSLIKSTEHNIIPFKKSLCGLVVKNNIYPEGVSVKSLDGDFIFTKKGISGPLAYKISSLKSRCDFPYEIKIKLFNIEDLKAQIELYPKKSVGNLVSALIPRSLAKVIVDDFGRKASEISITKLKNYCELNLTIISSAPDGEVVNSGGVDLAQLDKNFKSKLRKNLWFTGEVVDIDGFCGGFNLQNCWSSGYIVALDVVKSVTEL